MFVYISLIVICTLCGYELDHNSKKGTKYKVFRFFAFMSLFLVSGLRYKVGQDYSNTYVSTFYEILHGYQTRADFGFALLNKIIIFFGGGAQWVFIICSFVISFAVCKSIDDADSNKALSYFIYICGTFFFFSLNGMRQSVAIALFYYSLKYVRNKHPLNYFIINGIGALFHTSGLIFLPLYFVIGKDFDRKKKIILLIILAIAVPSITAILSNFLLSTRYAMYISNGAYQALSALNLSSILNIFLWICYEYLIPEKNGKDIIYSNVHYLGIISTIFLTSLPLMIRIFMMFRYVEFLSVPNLYKHIKIKFKIGSNTRLLLKCCIYILYFIYFVYSVLIMNGNNVLPYHTIFSQL